MNTCIGQNAISMHLQSKLERARVVTYISNDTVKITMHTHANSFGGQIERGLCSGFKILCKFISVCVCMRVCV